MRPERQATLLGRRLGHYDVRELLGRGGMGDVYRAFDTRLRREVALKVLPPDLASDPSREERFRREATAVAALSHPNVVVIHSVEEVDGSLFLTMELVSGRSLRAHLAERRLPIDARLALALQVGEGLAAAHAAGVIHRDLKPENVMISEVGTAKILDFGLAKLRATLPTDPGASTLADMTGPGIAMGTAQYMSPEQALGRDVDERADVFAFGALLFEMVTGESAFLGATGAATLDRILHRAPPSVASLDPDAPSALDALLVRALAKDREHRYRTMRELVSDLKAVLDGRQVVRPVQAPLAPESIAVLPFTDMSPERDQAYFCEGLAEELINRLARSPALRVVARTSAFALQGQGLDIAEVGRRLLVDSVLEGSVRKAGGKLRITVQLVSAREGYSLFSERYDRELEDVFAVQDEITELLVEKLQARLGLPTPPQPARTSGHLLAYDHYLRGLYAMNRWTIESVETAIRRFEDAIAAEPAYAPPYAALAECWIWQFSAIAILPASKMAPKARAAAERALELDPDLAAAHKCLGLIAMHYDWDREAARKSLVRANELSPNSADIHLGNALRLATLEGDFVRALAEYERAEQLDPLHLQIKTYVGYGHLFARDYPRAVEQFQRVLAIEPSFVFAHYGLGDALIQLGHHDAAIAALDESIRLGGRTINPLSVLAYAHARAGNERRARALLSEVLELAEAGYAKSLWLALVHLGLGELDQTFEWLGRAFEERDGSLVLVAVHPDFDPLRKDARFAVLLDKMGLGYRRSNGA